MSNRESLGFSLIELIVVIIVIGVLATLAIPTYNTMRERSLSQEALANLWLIAAAERIFRMETGGYYPSPGATQTDVDNINTNLKLSLTSTN